MFSRSTRSYVFLRTTLSYNDLPSTCWRRENVTARPTSLSLRPCLRDEVLKLCGRRGKGSRTVPPKVGTGRWALVGVCGPCPLVGGTVAPTHSLHRIPSPASSLPTPPRWGLTGAGPCRKPRNYMDRSFSKPMISTLTGTSASPSALTAS